MKLADFILPNAICSDLTSTGKQEALAELGRLLAGVCPDQPADAITRILADREKLATTGIGDGIAIPHGKSESLKSISGAVAISRAGVQFDAMDGRPVNIFVALLAPLNSTGDHLKALARVSRILKDADFRTRLLEAQTDAAIYTTMVEADAE